MRLPKNESSHKAVVLTADKFEDMEVFFPVFRLLEEGWEVDIAAPKIEKLSGEHDYHIDPDKTIDEINPDDYELLIIPGGTPEGAPATVAAMKRAQEIARSFFAKNKPVAAICHGPYTLISADVINGRRLTSYWEDGLPEQIKAAGGIWEDKPVVVDGNLVTSRFPGDLSEFTREMMKMVKK